MDKKTLMMGTGLAPLAFPDTKTGEAQRTYVASAIINGVRYEHTFSASAVAAKVAFPTGALVALAGKPENPRIQSQTLRAVPANVPFLAQENDQ